jgi:hypothetical protein
MSERPIAGPYRCPCGHSLPHNHGSRFPEGIEGELVQGGERYEIRRTGGYAPTWAAYPWGADRKQRRRIDQRRRKAERKARCAP